MAVQDYIPVSEASSELGVSEARVRALLDARHLDGYKLGGRWLVHGESIRRRQRAGTQRGRLLSPTNAWGVLALASGEPAEFVSPHERARLIRLLDSRGGIRRLASRLRSRAERQDFVAHPGVLGSLSKHNALMLTGANASRHHGLELVSGQELDAYVAARDLKRLRKEFALRPAGEGRANVRLRVDERPMRGRERYAPIAAVALDLAEEPDVRSAQIGRRVLGQLDKRRLWREYKRPRGRRPRAASR